MNDGAPGAPALASPWTWAVPLAGLGLAAVLVLGDVNHALFLVFNHALGPGHDLLWSNVTTLGDTLVVMSLAVPFAARRPDIAWAVLIAAVIATVLSHGIKELWPLPRPAGVFDADDFYLIGRRLRLGTFPSGHTIAITTFAAVVCLRVPRARVVFPLALLAFLVGLSRVVVGAHFPADAVGGWAFGWIAAVAGVWLADRSPAGFGRGAQTAILVFLVGCAAWLSFHDAGYPLARPLERVISALAVSAGLVNLYRAWHTPAAR